MSKQSLLLVDGDTRSLRVLEVSLRKSGFMVTAAGSVQDALDKLEMSAPDLIISETTFPDGDGFELRRRVREAPEWTEIPFIFLTAEAAIEHKIRGLELGVDDYLTKPIYIKEIVTRINILLQKRQRTRFEERRDGRTRFAGRVQDMPVVDVIQTIEISRKSGVIQFVGDRGRQAAIYFRDGKVIDAEAGTLVGEDAVYRLLTWSEGEFEVVFRTVRRRDVITTSSQGLLMEGMRRLDEWSRLLEQLPSLSHRFEVDTNELTARLGEVPDDNNRILRLVDGRRTLLEVIDASDVGDLECLQVISRLFFEELLVDLDHGRPAKRDTGKPMPLVEVRSPLPLDDSGSGPYAAARDSGPYEVPVVEPETEATDADVIGEEPVAPLLGSYRPSSLMLIDAAVAAAAAFEPSLLQDAGDDDGPSTVEPPVITPVDESIVMRREESGLRMIGSLGRDRAEASGELSPLGGAQPLTATQRELVTILPRRITREIALPPGGILGAASVASAGAAGKGGAAGNAPVTTSGAPTSSAEQRGASASGAAGSSGASAKAVSASGTPGSGGATAKGGASGATGSGTAGSSGSTAKGASSGATGSGAAGSSSAATSGVAVSPGSRGEASSSGAAPSGVAVSPGSRGEVSSSGASASGAAGSSGAMAKTASSGATGSGMAGSRGATGSGVAVSLGSRGEASSSGASASGAAAGSSGAAARAVSSGAPASGAAGSSGAATSGVAVSPGSRGEASSSGASASGAAGSSGATAKTASSGATGGGVAGSSGAATSGVAVSPGSRDEASSSGATAKAVSSGAPASGAAGSSGASASGTAGSSAASAKASSSGASASGTAGSSAASAKASSSGAPASGAAGSSGAAASDATSAKASVAAPTASRGAGSEPASASSEGAAAGQGASARTASARIRAASVVGIPAVRGAAATGRASESTRDSSTMEAARADAAAATDRDARRATERAAVARDASTTGADGESQRIARAVEPAIAVPRTQTRTGSGVRSQRGPGAGAIALLVLAAAIAGLAVFLKYRKHGGATADAPSAPPIDSAIVSPPPIADAAAAIVPVPDAAVAPVAPDAAIAPDAATAHADGARGVDPVAQAKVLMEQAHDALEAGDFATASARASDSLKLRKTARTYLVLAQALQRLDKIDESLSAVDAATALAPDYAASWELRGRILWAARRRDEARVAFAKFLALEPTGPRAAGVQRLLSEPR